MFARWSRTAATYLDSQLRAAGISSSIAEDGDYSIDLSTLHAFLSPLPDDTLQCLAGICGETLAPVRDTLLNDIEVITDLFLQLETSLHHEESSDSSPEPELSDTPLPAPTRTPSPPPMARRPIMLQETISRPRPSSRRRQPTFPVEVPIMIPNTHPSAPSILITPCGSQPHENACRVPYQDKNFGGLLTVPSHPCYNDVHPPMAASSMSNTLPALDNWVWRDGHWEAVLPCLQQQEKRGLFSKMISARRRSHRPSAKEC